jgi:pyridoxal phosphate enzyme (YggS family)
MITDNLKSIKSHLNGTNAKLIAVSKQQPNDRIEQALDSGIRTYGENKVQEATERWAHRKADYNDLDLHLIGPLQTNKVKQAVALFDCVHTLDREKLARSIHTYAPNMPCFIQVNTGAENQKSGVLLPDLNDFHAFCKNDLNMTIMGLMSIPPIDEPAGLHFALLAENAKRLHLPHLSMGMSGDYPLALKYGATHIRVGSKLFGERN